MNFIILEKIQTVVFWTAKSGCSVVKYLINYYEDNKISTDLKDIHIDKYYQSIEFMQKTDEELKEIINKINDFNLIQIIRNPYERVVSGFLDKYIKGKTLYGTLPRKIKNFEDFVVFLNKKENTINAHHFHSQTIPEGFDLLGALGKSIDRYYDLREINSFNEYLASKYNKPKIEPVVINNTQTNNICIKKLTYLLSIHLTKFPTINLFIIIKFIKLLVIFTKKI